MFNQPARLHHLRGFGSLAYVKLWPRPAKLTAHQAFLGVFIDFSSRADACQFWDPVRDIIVMSISFRTILHTNDRHYQKYVLPPSSAYPSNMSPPPLATSRDHLPSSATPDSFSPPLPPSHAPFSCAVGDCRSCALERIFWRFGLIKKQLPGL